MRSKINLYPLPNDEDGEHFDEECAGHMDGKHLRYTHDLHMRNLSKGVRLADWTDLEDAHIVVSIPDFDRTASDLQPGRGVATDQATVTIYPQGFGSWSATCQRFRDPNATISGTYRDAAVNGIKALDRRVDCRLTINSELFATDEKGKSTSGEMIVSLDPSVWSFNVEEADGSVRSGQYTSGWIQVPSDKASDPAWHYETKVGDAAFGNKEFVLIGDKVEDNGDMAWGPAT
jgi:hypothetical protein